MRPLKKPEDVNAIEKSRNSCKTVSEVFSKRPWVIDVWETTQNQTDDQNGIDMFVRPSAEFLIVAKMGGKNGILSVQIKSSRKRKLKKFVNNHRKELRFFNVVEKRHLFVLCGSEEPEFVLADIVGQIVFHVSRLGIREKDILNCFGRVGDKEAIAAYVKYKKDLALIEYDSWLPKTK